jgi:hypothetical protein
MLIPRIVKTAVHNLPPHLIPLPTKPHGMIPQLCPKDFLYHHNRFICLHINMREEPLKPPSDSLPSHPEGLVDILPIRSLQNHIAGPIRLQFHP